MAQLLRLLESAGWSEFWTSVPPWLADQIARDANVTKRELKKGIRQARWVHLAFRGGRVTVERTQRELSELRPLCVTEHNGRDIWVYQGRVYSGATGLGEDDVLALIEKQENGRQRELRRAHALQAMAGSPATRDPIPTEVKTEVWRRDAGACVQCGSNENLEFDHIIPLSMGGANTIRNLQLLCMTCNRSKGATLG